jgi:SSS family solute:Na+ symporter
MSIQLAIVVLYIVLLFAISFYVKRRASQNPTEYLFAGRKLSTPLVAVSVTGLAVGAASTVGVAESATQIGLSAGWYNGAWGIGAIVMGLLAAGKYRELNCTTIPELFERCYDKKARLISVFGLSLIMICITSLQYVAGGSILSTLMPDIFSMHGGMITSAIVFIGITAIGGLWSSGLSNILSVALIYLGILYSMITIVVRDGGIAAINAKLPPANFDWFGPMSGLAMSVLLGWILVMVSQAITAQGTVQIACGAKDSKTARNGFIWGGILIFPIGFFSAVLGLAAKAQYADLNPTLALPRIIMSLDPFSSGITLAALWAADVSTACTILLGAGTLISQDIYKRFMNPNVSKENFLKINRWVILLIGIGTLWLAFNAVGIVKVMMIGLSLTTAFTLVFLCTIFCPSLCRKNTAFYTTLVGIAGLFLWQLVPAIHFLPHVIYFEWLICIITLILVRLFDHEPITLPERKPDEEFSS